MLFSPEYFPYFCNGYLLLSGFLFICAGYAYRANRQNKDPQKRDFHFGTIFLTPLTWPFFVLVYILIFIIRAIVFSFWLTLAILGLFVIREPFLFIWLNKIATKIGNKLLEANTLLIKAFFG